MIIYVRNENIFSCVDMFPDFSIQNVLLLSRKLHSISFNQVLKLEINGNENLKLHFLGIHY